MRVEVEAPCSLALGVVRLETAAGPQTALLGITLQHPPVHLAAERAPALGVTGARADLAYAQAQRVLQAQAGLQPAAIAIELAIPSYMGLGSEAMLAQSVASALAQANGRPAAEQARLARAAGLRPEHALEQFGFEQGGILLAAVDGPAPQLLRQHVLAHAEAGAWAFVLHLPHRPRDLASTFEADRLAQCLQAAPHLSANTGALVSAELWPALEQDDLAGFAHALSDLQALNRAALEQAGLFQPPTAEAQGVLDFMRAHGAVAVGESLTGLARWGLICGARPSIELRHGLTRHVGHDGGTVMASICATTGAKVAPAAPAGQP